MSHTPELPIAANPDQLTAINVITDIETVPERSDRVFTPATIGLTLPRAVAGIALPFLAARGHNTTGLTVAAGLSDKETLITNAIDKRWPGSGMGNSQFGAEADYLADSVLGIGSTVAAFTSPRSPVIAKVAAGIGVVKQISQARWAIAAGLEHKRKTGERLKAEVDMTGKLGTAALIGSNILGTIARDIRIETTGQRKAQKWMGVGAVVLSVAALGLGEKARRRHDRNFRAKMDALEAVPAT